LSACHPLEAIWAVDSLTDSSQGLSHKNDKEITRKNKNKNKKNSQLVCPLRHGYCLMGPIYTQLSVIYYRQQQEIQIRIILI